MSEITPGSVMAGFWRWFGVALFGLVVLGALIYAGWRAGWWFTSQNINRTNHAIQNGYANQNALTQQISAEFTDIATAQADAKATPANAPADKATILATAGQICQQIPQLAVSYDPAWKTWAQANCADGALSATSPLR